MKLYQRLAKELGTNPRNHNMIKTLATQWMPIGGGFNRGTTILVDLSNANKFVFDMPYQLVHDGQGTDCWFDFRVIVTADFVSRYRIILNGPSQFTKLHSRFIETIRTCLDKEVP